MPYVTDNDLKAVARIPEMTEELQETRADSARWGVHKPKESLGRLQRE